MNINTKMLKANLTIDNHKQICKALDIPMYAETNSQIIYYTGDKHVNAYNGSPKLIFYKDTQIYIGYTSGLSYDIIGLTQRRLSLLKRDNSFLDAVNFILDVTGISLSQVERHTNPVVYDWESDLGHFIRFKRTKTTLPTYDSSIINQLPTIFPQPWIDEGISIDSMEKYMIRYYPRCNQTVIPVFGRDGNLHGIRVRNWEADVGKYMPLITLDGECYKFNTNNLLYGLNYNWAEIERTKTVVIGESEKMVLKFDTWFHEKSCAVGMFGGSLGDYRRNELLKLGVKRVILVPDNDWIGRDDTEIEEWGKKIKKQIALWNGYAQVEVVWDSLELLSPKENATDRTLEVWNQLYANRTVSGF